MAFRIPTTRVELLRVLSAKADVSQVKAAAVWDAMLALARDGIRKNGSFSFPGLGKLVRVTRRARRGYNLVTGKRVRLPEKEDLAFRVSKIAKGTLLPRGGVSFTRSAARPEEIARSPRSAARPEPKGGASGGVGRRGRQKRGRG